MTLYITHDAGLFSCTTICLVKIMEYYIHHGKLPDSINTQYQYAQYKPNNIYHTCIRNRFFIEDIQYKIPENLIVTKTGGSVLTKSVEEDQFSDYKDLKYDEILPFVKRYFVLSNDVKTKIKTLTDKYNLDYSNICGVFYRGNDKACETIQPEYTKVIEKAKMIYNINPDIQFVVQTDENEFLNMFLEYFPNAIHFTEIPKINKAHSSIQFTLNDDEKIVKAQYYIASLWILSQCKYVIHTSGNGEMWIALFRENVNNMIQYLRPIKTKNDTEEKDYWITHINV